MLLRKVLSAATPIYTGIINNRLVFRINFLWFKTYHIIKFSGLNFHENIFLGFYFCGMFISVVTLRTLYNMKFNTSMVALAEALVVAIPQRQPLISMVALAEALV